MCTRAQADSPGTPLLSVLAVVGAERSRFAPLVEALAGQTVAGQIEVILVDVAPEGVAGIEVPAGLDVRIVRRPGSWDWGAARAESVRRARAPVVAFLEDHTVPDRHWAEEVRGAFDSAGQNVIAFCYAFTNGSPDTWFYRSVFMTEYGPLAHPLPAGSPPSSAANNIAYRRESLLALGEELDELLELDFFLQNAMGPAFEAVAAPRALLAHQTNTHLRDLLVGHFEAARLFANRRLRHETWSLPKRLVAAASIPVLVPALRLKRLFSALRGRRRLARDAVLALPMVVTLYVAGALGEAVGLLLAGELSARRLMWLELVAPRERR